MTKFTVFLKIVLAALGLVMVGFGILSYYIAYISGQYAGETGTGIATELSNWGLSFVLDPVVQVVFVLVGAFIFIISLWSVLQEFGKCYS